MIVVDTGSSMNSVVKPNAPPTAPEVAAASLCQRVDAALPGVLSIVHNAAWADLNSAASTAPWMRRDTESGRRLTANSSGEPIRLAILAVSVGDSSRSTARCRSRQSCEVGRIEDSNGGGCGEVMAFMAAIIAPPMYTARCLACRWLNACAQAALPGDARRSGQAGRPDSAPMN
ncbi:hypothetical protein D3C71_1158840 [compost metagenome]